MVLNFSSIFGSTLTNQIGDCLLGPLLQLLEILLDVSFQIPIGFSGRQIVDILEESKREMRLAGLSAIGKLIVLTFSFPIASQPLTISSTTFLSFSASSWSWMWSSTERKMNFEMLVKDCCSKFQIENFNVKRHYKWNKRKRFHNSPDSGWAFGSFCSFSCSSIGT